MKATNLIGGRARALFLAHACVLHHRTDADDPRWRSTPSPSHEAPPRQDRAGDQRRPPFSTDVLADPRVVPTDDLGEGAITDQTTLVHESAAPHEQATGRGLRFHTLGGLTTRPVHAVQGRLATPRSLTAARRLLAGVDSAGTVRPVPPAPLLGHQASAGFGMAEVLAIMVLIAVLVLATVPTLLSFLRAMEARGAAQQVVSVLNQARQLAITTNTSYRVEVDTAGNRLRFVRVADGTPWTGPGTDGQGYRTLENAARLAAVTTNPVFTALGTATESTITVQDSRQSGALGVAVSTAGRVSIQ